MAPPPFPRAWKVHLCRCSVAQRDSLHKGKLTLSRQKDPKNGKLHSRTIYLGEKQSFPSSDITDSSIGLLTGVELSGVSKLYQKVRWQKGDWFVLKRARKHVLGPNPSYYMAQPINGEM